MLASTEFYCPVNYATWREIGVDQNLILDDGIENFKAGYIVDEPSISKHIQFI